MLRWFAGCACSERLLLCEQRPPLPEYLKLYQRVLAIACASRAALVVVRACVFAIAEPKRKIAW